MNKILLGLNRLWAVLNLLVSLCFSFWIYPMAIGPEKYYFAIIFVASILLLSAALFLFVLCSLTGKRARIYINWFYPFSYLLVSGIWFYMLRAGGFFEQFYFDEWPLYLALISFIFPLLSWPYFRKCINS